MSHVQLSLLGGSSQIDPGKRYRKARYDFGSGPGEPTEFFAAALLRHIQPGRLVILGTSGSMWDVLLESLVPGDEHHDQLLELIDAAAGDRVVQAQLDELAPRLEAALATEVRLRLIPYGRTLAEQVAILQLMTADLDPGDTVNLDVTHGLRHLPMLAQMSALYLRKARRVTIGGIHYGALDMTRDGVTPVMDLKGLLEIADWVGALHTFDKDGDYGVFADLLEADGLSETETAQLRRSAFLERTSNAYLAQRSLHTFTQSVTPDRFVGAASLFAAELEQRLDWHKKGDLYRWQSTLARQYLQRGDYIRTAIFGYEAFVTRLIEPPEQDGEYTDRERAYKAYENDERGPVALKQDYFMLKNLRNALAHGNRPKDKKIAKIAEDPQRLPAELKRLLDRLLSG